MNFYARILKISSDSFCAEFLYTKYERYKLLFPSLPNEVSMLFDLIIGSHFTGRKVS